MEMTFFVFPQESGTNIIVFNGNKAVALKVGYIEITSEQYQKLLNHELCWKNKELVPYSKTEPELTFERRRLEKQAKLNEIKEIEAWFEEYDNQVKQYQRCVRLEIEYDNKIGSMRELDQLATLKAGRLAFLRENL